MILVRKNFGILMALAVFLSTASTSTSAIGFKIVNGRILNNDYDPISGATVLLSLDGRFIGGVMTDIDGNFTLQFESGENDICSLNILSKNYRGIFSEVEIYEDTVYVEYTLEAKPLGLI